MALMNSTRYDARRSSCEPNPGKYRCSGCGTEQNFAGRCEDCRHECDCGAEFRRKGDFKNHKTSDHCAACGEAHDDMEHFALDTRFRDDDCTIQLIYIHAFTGHVMGGGYLCDGCTTADLDKRPEFFGWV